ncbi:MAG: glycosyl hydrolase family 28-related protein [Armatimonadota bacterium]
MKGITMLSLAMLLVAACAAECKTQPSDALVSANVMSYGAKGDGKADDTAAFQKALDATGKKGGITLVPSGTYLIAGSLNIPAGVTLQGVWQAPHNTALGKGSVIFATGNAGKEDGPALIVMNENTCVKGLTIFYPDQNIDNVKPYPWTIQGKGTNCSIIDVTLANPYKGIDFGSNWNELHYIKNVYGCPLKVGVLVDQCSDIGRMEDVHFNPNAWVRSGYANAPTGPKFDTLQKYLNDNLEGFIFARTDWEYVSNCFVIFPKIGFHFISREKGPGNVLVTQSGSDICDTAVQVDETQGHAGVEFTNCQFMSRIVVGPKNRGPIKFANCGFWHINTTDNQAVIEGIGTVTFTAAHFSGWAKKDPEAACILVKSGSVIVNGCEFRDYGKKQIELGPDTLSAAIFGSQFWGGQKITNNAPAKASVQIGLNIELK